MNIDLKTCILWMNTCRFADWVASLTESLHRLVRFADWVASQTGSVVINM